MKTKQLMILSATAIVLVTLAFVTNRKPDSTTGANGTVLLLPETLAVNDITEVSLRSREGPVTLRQHEGRWVVTEKYDYPADFDKLRRLILKLANMKAGQRIPANESQRQRMGLILPNAEVAAESYGTLLSLKSRTGSTQAQLLIGNPRLKPGDDAQPFRAGFPDGHYVSTDGGQTALLVAEPLTEVQPRPMQWIQREILNISGRDIVQIEVSGPNRQAIRLSRAQEGAPLTLEGLDESEEMVIPAVQRMENALAFVRFEDLADPELSVEDCGLDTPTIFRATTKDGQVVDVRIGSSRDNLHYARFTVSLLPEPVADADGEENDEDALAERTAKRARLEEDTAQRQQRLSPWTYLLAEHQVANMKKTREQLAKAAEPEPEPDGEHPIEN